MPVSKRKRALDPEQLAKLPYLTTSQIALLGGGLANSTVRRSGLKPIGKRGRSYVYDRADVMRMLAGEPVESANAAPLAAAPMRRTSASSSNADAIAAIREIAKQP